MKNKAAAPEKSRTTSAVQRQKAGASFFKASGEGGFFSSSVASRSFIQAKMAVSQPGDKFEKEAEKTASRVMKMPAPVSPEKEEKLQRAGAGAPVVSESDHAAIQTGATGGTPLSADVRGYMEPRFGADFSNVRIHTDGGSSRLNRNLGARAFTYQNHIFFSRDQYQPGTSEGRNLLAHELTHTIQQGHAVQRSPQIATTTTQPLVQRSVIGEILDWIADKANYIPGFRMFTVILGLNPVNMRSVDRSAANILRALIEFMPGGGFITQALDNYGVFDKIGNWIEGKIRALGMVGSMFSGALRRFLDSLGMSDLAPWNWGDVWDRAKRIFTEPIGKLIDFAKGVVTDILKFVKDAILKPLAALAQGTRGYDLLKTILGEDPITGEPVPRNADTLIGGFMKLIGQEDVWENIKKGNAIARAWTWFQGALSGLMGFVRTIPRKIIDTIKSLTFQDIITVAGAFRKIVGAFVNIAFDFISWGLTQVISLLEILFSVVAPGVMPYIKKAQTAFVTIIKNPIGFIGNLVRAGKLGFEQFAGNFVEHLKSALIKWLVGPLADAGVYIPKAFTLIEIIKLVLSVLGLTWQNIRSKLVKIIPEPVLVALEKTASILVTLVKDGPAAAWEQIKAELTELKDQLISQIIQMVTTEIVKAAVLKLVSMLNPVGAVIQAIIAIYNTIMFFIEKARQIAAVVASFINSIAAIAAGQVAPAAKRVEQTLANTLTVVIAFLARFIGLGGIPAKIVGVVKKIRQPIDKGLDKIVAWLGKMLSKAKDAVKKMLQWWKKKVPVSVDGDQHTLTFEGTGNQAKLVLRSEPEKPSVFLTKAAEKVSVPAAKRAIPVSVAVTHENNIQGFQTKLIKYEDSPASASGTKNTEADAVMGKLDSEMAVLGTHIGSTLKTWGVSDDKISGVNLPRGSFSVEQKRGIAEQHADKSELRENVEGKLINVRKGLARRHVVSSYDMAQHYMTALNGKKMSEGKLLLEQRASIADARIQVDDVTQAGIQKAATARYSKFFGYLRNMFIGDSRENSSIQEYIDKGHPEMVVTKLQEHVSHMKRAWAFEQNMKISGLDEN